MKLLKRFKANIPGLTQCHDLQKLRCDCEVADHRPLSTVSTITSDESQLRKSVVLVKVLEISDLYYPVIQTSMQCDGKINDLFSNIFSDQYVGCYVTNSGFSHQQQPDLITTNSIDNCITYCRSKQYTFAGAQVRS